MKACLYLIGAVALAALAPAAALGGSPAPQINIESKIVEVTANASQELGFQWGFQGQYGGIFRGGQPTGEAALEFEPTMTGVGGGVDLSVQLPRGDATFLGRPVAVTLTGGASGSMATGSDNILRVPGIAGGLRDLRRIDGGAGFNLTGAQNAAFSAVLRALEVRAGAAATVLTSPQVQVRSGVQAVIRDINESTRFSVQNGGQDNRITSDLDTQSVGLILNVTPIISVSDGITLNIDAFAGPNLMRTEMDLRQTVNNQDFMVRQTETTLGFEAGGGGSVVIGGLLDDRLTISAGGQARFLGDIPFLRTAFGNSPASIGRGDRTELLIFVTARIMFDTTK